MRMDVVFRNPATGEQKKVKVGWSWTLFFFTSVFGLPLFLRRLYSQGFVVFAICVIGNLGQLFSRPAIIAVNFLLLCAAHIFFAIKGNEITAKKLLSEGWEFADPNSDATKFGKFKWRIGASAAVNTQELS